MDRCLVASSHACGARMIFPSIFGAVTTFGSRLESFSNKPNRNKSRTCRTRGEWSGRQMRQIFAPRNIAINSWRLWERRLSKIPPQGKNNLQAACERLYPQEPRWFRCNKSCCLGSDPLWVFLLSRTNLSNGSSSTLSSSGTLDRNRSASPMSCLST
jgi:hypothetical protein